MPREINEICTDITNIIASVTDPEESQPFIALLMQAFFFAKDPKAKEHIFNIFLDRLIEPLKTKDCVNHSDILPKTKNLAKEINKLYLEQEDKDAKDAIVEAVNNTLEESFKIDGYNFPYEFSVKIYSFEDVLRISQERYQTECCSAARVA